MRPVELYCATDSLQSCAVHVCVGGLLSLQYPIFIDRTLQVYWKDDIEFVHAMLLLPCT